MKLNLLLPLLICISANCLCCKKKNIEPTLVQDTVTNPGSGGNPTGGEDFSHSGVLMTDMLGVNGFDWEYTQDNSGDLDVNKINLINSFSGFRQYLDWDKIENKEGAFNLSHFDQIYKKNAELGITTLLCLQIIPGWMRKTYPEYVASDPFGSLRDYTPVPYGSDKSVPASYVAMAKAGFQIAARYGSNTTVDKTLLKVPAYEQNQPPFALNILKYIECSNEPDKTWRGPNAKQTPEQYAAQLSAFYDGHMGTLGKDVGVKTADPNMKVVMAGLADPDPDFVKRMIEWCKKNRVKNGTYSLCFDVINYHHYSNENWNKGIAPELSNAAAVASEFVAIGKQYGNTEVWVTECGFDVNARSPQAAMAIGSKTTRDTQADWTLRTSLMYARKGIKKTFFFMLNDVNIDDATQYSSAGLIENNKRRPSADYVYQTKKLMAGYDFKNSISTDPIVDLYISDNKKMYVVTVPDQKNRKVNYILNLDKSVNEVTIYTPKSGSDQMEAKKQAVTEQKISINATETPTFIQIN